MPILGVNLKTYVSAFHLTPATGLRLQNLITFHGYGLLKAVHHSQHVVIFYEYA